jgi:Flp pilus assembly protein TadG
MIRGHPWIARGRGGNRLGNGGSVAVELGLLVPLLVILTVGIVDLGNFLNYSQALQAAARIGAEYARNHPTCQSGINMAASPPTISADCTTGIKDAMTKSLNYDAGALTFPASFPLTGECDDGTSITLGSSCAAAGRPAPNRVFITVSANQSYTPMISWGGLFPTNLAAVTEFRLQ